jgi:radical SAM-linked protein
MRLFMRALRRADLPIKISEGFHPHPKLSIRRALRLGAESENEEAIAALTRNINPEEFKGRLRQCLPEGIEIRDAQRNFN